MKLDITDENLEALQRPNSGTLQIIDSDKSFFQVNVGKFKTTFYMVTSRRSRNFRENLGHWPDISAEQARDEAIMLHGMIRAGKTPRRKTAGSKTLREAFDRSIALREMDNLITPDTAQQYRLTFDRHLTKLGTYSLDEIHEDDIYDLKIRLKDSPYVFKFIRAMLSQVYRMNSLPSPFSSVTVMRTTKRDTKIMDHHEWVKQVFALQNPVLRNFKLLSALTGVRAGNMQTVKPEHVDLDEQTLFLPKTKTNKNVTLPLSAVACDLFDELIQYSEARNKSWVFFSRKDKPLRYATKAVQGRHHDTRRIFTTAAMNAELSDTLIKKLRGDVMHSVHGSYVIDKVPTHIADRVTAEVLKILSIDEEAVYTRAIKNSGKSDTYCDLRTALL